ncbi:hypothetical protein [Mycolicibacterium pyrenivorans]|uniref:hypothetical protein n=1 Tax=Mycolicibacterium pyrenivorans TaxID=187102 RepID=UPI0021F2D544|nr:hypothetical protein [Mycolicibacterium pyrenivorans]MCV7151900.1 hypothetical protein [Mycolicibacterium pyrenivorans]
MNSLKLPALVDFPGGRQPAATLDRSFCLQVQGGERVLLAAPAGLGNGDLRVA